MRKFSIVLGLLIILVLLGAALIWTKRIGVAEHFLSKELKVPVSIQALEFSKNRADVSSISIGNPPSSKRPISFTTQKMSIEASLEEILGNPLTIEEIDMSDIYIGIEFYDKAGTDNNWSRILDVKNISQKKKSKDYLIRRLVLTNLTVEVIQADGTSKTYPTIPRMEFQNISSDTGFPIDEIEKAIFDLVLKDILRRFNLIELIKTIDPLESVPGGSPLKYLPLLK